jgi:hypothetical protein
MVKRESWEKSDYFLITLGGVIGFSCLWRFPYLIFENGFSKKRKYIFFTFFTNISFGDNSFDCFGNGNRPILPHIITKNL